MQPSQRRYYSLAVATLGFLVLGVSLFSYSTISVIFSKQFSLSNTESGLMTAAFALAYTVVQIPAGLISDRIGGARTLLLSFVIVTLAPVVLLLGGGYGIDLVSRGITGLGAGMILPGGVRLLASAFHEKELDRAMGVLGTGWGLSQTLAYLALPLLIFGQDWHPPIEFTILLSVAATLLAVPPARWDPKRVVSQVKTKLDVRGLLTLRLFALVLGNFTSLIIQVGILAWAPSLLGTTLKLSEIDAGRLISIVGVAGAASSFAGGVLSQRVGPRPVIMTSMVLLVVVPYFLATSTTWAVALLCLALLGIGGNIYFGPLTALVPYSSDRGPEVAGISFGIFNTMSNIGNFLSPIIIGYALDSTGSFTIGFTVLGVIGISGIIGTLLIKNRKTMKS